MPPLQPSEFSAHFKSISKSDWQKLFELMPVIESTRDFSFPVGLEDLKKGILSFPMTENARIVERFANIFLELGLMINFDWAAWEEGKALISDPAQDFNELDELTLCKLLSAVIRNDRFCDGVLAGYFEKGVMQKILRALEKKVNDMNP